MSTQRIITTPLHRVRDRHGKRFAAEPAPEAAVPAPARVAVMLALAHKIREAIVRGTAADQAEVARRLDITPARLSQLLDLLYLSPEVQERILFLEATAGHQTVTEHSLRAVVRTRAWSQQRRLFAELRPKAGEDTRRAG